jgi:hypothetical protein
LSHLSRDLEEAAKAEDLADGAAKVGAMARGLDVVLEALPRTWQEMTAAPAE